MSGRTVIRHSEELRRAVRWISERREEDPAVSLARLLSEAGPRFNLSPMDQQSLALILREQEEQPHDS